MGDGSAESPNKPYWRGQEAAKTFAETARLMSPGRTGGGSGGGSGSLASQQRSSSRNWKEMVREVGDETADSVTEMKEAQRARALADAWAAKGEMTSPPKIVKEPEPPPAVRSEPSLAPSPPPPSPPAPATPPPEPEPEPAPAEPPAAVEIAPAPAPAPAKPAPIEPPPPPIAVRPKPVPIQPQVNNFVGAIPATSDPALVQELRGIRELLEGLLPPRATLEAMGAATGKLGEATTGLGAATIALKDTAATIEATLERSVQAQMYVASSAEAEPERTSEPEPTPQATDKQHDPDAEEDDEPEEAPKTDERPTSRTAKQVKDDYEEGKQWHEDQKRWHEDQKLLSPENVKPCAELRDARTLNFRNMKITGDLSYADLSCADFYGADLTGCNLQCANLTRCDLALADMTGVDLRGACLFQARIVGAKLAFASLERARLILCDGEPGQKAWQKNVKRKMVTPNDYNDKQLAGLIGVYEFEVKDLIRPDTKSSERAYERAVIQSDKEERDDVISKWRNDLKFRNGWKDAREVVDLYQVVGNDAFYSGSKISRALMMGGNFRKSQFNQTVLFQANLGNAMMRGVKMRDADIEQSDAARCKFENADLSGTSFKMAKLRGATFEQAQLGNATVFDGADFGPFKLPSKRQTKLSTKTMLMRLGMQTAAATISTEGEDAEEEVEGALEEVEDAVETGLEELEEIMGENAFADVLDTMAEMAAEKMQDINLLCTAVLKSIKDARRNPSEYVSVIFKSADGLKWQNKGMVTPVRGSELTNDKLATALQTKQQFDANEWRDFGIHNLRRDHYIMTSDGNYYQPAESKNVDGTKWNDVGSTRPAGGVELRNEKLASRLREQQTHFTMQEWHDFGVSNLRRGHYVKAGERYFEPDVADSNSKLLIDAIKAFESKNEEKLANAIIEALNGVFSAVLTAGTVKKIEKKIDIKIDLTDENKIEKGTKRATWLGRWKACCGPEAKLEQKWTLVSEDANGKGRKREKGAKGAVTLIMERLCSRLIRRLGEGVARSLITQGSYGSAQSIAMRRWQSARSKLQAFRGLQGKQGKLLAATKLFSATVGPAAVAPNPKGSNGSSSPRGNTSSPTPAQPSTLLQSPTKKRLETKQQQAKEDPKGAVEKALAAALEPMLKQMLGGDDGGDETIQVGNLVKMVMLHLAQRQLEKYKLHENLEKVGKVASHYEDALRRTLGVNTRGKQPGTNLKESLGDGRSFSYKLVDSISSSRAKQRSVYTKLATTRGITYLLQLTWNALFWTDPVVTAKHKNELIYVQDKLKELEGKQLTKETWQEFFESFSSLLMLRGKMESNCAHSIFDAILSDRKAIDCLGTVQHLNLAIGGGDQLVHLLKTGPAKHLKNHAYDYKRKISSEIASIDRLQGVRQFLIQQAVVLFASVGFGVSAFFARLVYDRTYGEFDLKDVTRD